MANVTVTYYTLKATSTKLDDLENPAYVSRGMGRMDFMRYWVGNSDCNGNDAFPLLAVFTQYPTVRPRVPDNLRFPTRPGE